MAPGDDAADDEMSEVGESSWLEQLGESFGSILVGLLLIAGACVLLFWNEGRAVRTARSLQEGSDVVRTVSADTIDPANEGRRVHIVGMLKAGGPAEDPEFDMKSPGVRLRRTVEMYQWAEDQQSEQHKRLGGGEETRTTYRYGHSWSDLPIDSEQFHDRHGHANPEMAYRTRLMLAPNIKLGAFFVPPEVLYRFGSEQSLQAGEAQAQALAKRIDRPVRVADGVLYIGKDPGQPAVGDYRITFTDVPLQTASVVAQQAGETFEPYRTQAGDAVEMMSAGQRAAVDRFKDAQDDNPTWTWAIRAAGCVLMGFGFATLMAPIQALADVIPLLGDCVAAGVGLPALAFTAILAPVIIAVAWFAYRPMVAMGALAAGVVLAAAALWLAHRRKARGTAAPA
jgi:hypothetical protein